MSIFSDLKPKNQASRNAFDLSRRSVFSNKVGVIRPCLSLPTMPSSEYEIDMSQLMRTQPLETAAFSGASINYDFVFVPYNQLYSSFNEFIAQREDAHHVGQPDFNVIPSFYLGDFLAHLIPLAAIDLWLTKFSDEDLIKYKGLGALSDFYFDGLKKCSYYISSLPTYSAALSAISQLDMLGYGNFLPLVKQVAMILPKIFEDLVSEPMHVLGIPQDLVLFVQYCCVELDREVSAYDVAGYIVSSPTFANLFYTYYGYSFVDYIETLTVGLSLWPLLAYNKAFYEYYRNAYYDERITLLYTSYGDSVEFNTITEELENFSYVQSFNLDDLPNFQTFDEQTFMRLLCICAQKPHQYKRDMFTGVLPSTQFGSVSMMTTDNSLRRLLYFDSELPSPVVLGRTNTGQNANGIFPLMSNGGNYQNSTNSKYDSAKFQFNPALAISVLEARQADALQRFKERMLRAGNKTKDIFEAHGWSRPKSQSDFEPLFLGSYDGRLDINTVASTTETEKLQLGQLAANGVCVVNGKSIRIKTSDFGLILCLQYIVKAAEYDSYGIDVQHTLLEAFDFPYPELQNISLVPVSQEHLNVLTPNNMQEPSSVVPQILGYLPRSFGYKTAVDSLHGEFYTNPFPPNLETYENEFPLVDGAFSNWVSPKRDTDANQSRYLSFHYIQIDCMDNLFKLSASSNPDTDEFLFNVQFDIKAVQPLPVIGLPI